MTTPPYRYTGTPGTGVTPELHKSYTRVTQVSDLGDDDAPAQVHGDPRHGRYTRVTQELHKCPTWVLTTPPHRYTGTPGTGVTQE
eukprot:9087515-Pyramimonas_sp.AAC.1